MDIKVVFDIEQGQSRDTVDKIISFDTSMTEGFFGTTVLIVKNFLESINIFNPDPSSNVPFCRTPLSWKDGPYFDKKTKYALYLYQQSRQRQILDYLKTVNSLEPGEPFATLEEKVLGIFNSTVGTLTEATLAVMHGFTLRGSTSPRYTDLGYKFSGENEPPDPLGPSLLVQSCQEILTFIYRFEIESYGVSLEEVTSDDQTDSSIEYFRRPDPESWDGLPFELSSSKMGHYIMSEYSLSNPPAFTNKVQERNAINLLRTRVFAQILAVNNISRDTVVGVNLNFPKDQFSAVYRSEELLNNVRSGNITADLTYPGVPTRQFINEMGLEQAQDANVLSGFYLDIPLVDLTVLDFLDSYTKNDKFIKFAGWVPPSFRPGSTYAAEFHINTRILECIKTLPIIDIDAIEQPSEEVAARNTIERLSEQLSTNEENFVGINSAEIIQDEWSRISADDNQAMCIEERVRNLFYSDDGSKAIESTLSESKSSAALKIEKERQSAKRDYDRRKALERVRADQQSALQSNREKSKNFKSAQFKNDLAQGFAGAQASAGGIEESTMGAVGFGSTPRGLDAGSLIGNAVSDITAALPPSPPELKNPLTITLGDLESKINKVSKIFEKAQEDLEEYDKQPESKAIVPEINLKEEAKELSKISSTMRVLVNEALSRESIKINPEDALLTILIEPDTFGSPPTQKMEVIKVGVSTSSAKKKYFSNGLFKNSSRMDPGSRLRSFPSVGADILEIPSYAIGYLISLDNIITRSFATSQLTGGCFGFLKPAAALGIVQNYTIPSPFMKPKVADGDYPTVAGPFLEAADEIRQDSINYAVTFDKAVLNWDPKGDSWDANDIKPDWSDIGKAVCNLDVLYIEFLDRFNISLLLCQVLKCMGLWPINLNLDLSFKLPPIPKLPTFSYLGQIGAIIKKEIIKAIASTLCKVAQQILDLLKLDCRGPDISLEDKPDYGDFRDSMPEQANAILDSITDMGFPIEFFENAKGFVDDAGALLSPSELCGLYNGQSTEKVKTILSNLLKVSYQDNLARFMRSDRDIEKFFAKLGLFGASEVCNALQQAIEEQNIRDDELIPKDCICLDGEQLRDKLCKDTEEIGIILTPQQCDAALKIAKKNKDKVKKAFEDLANGTLVDSIIPDIRDFSNPSSPMFNLPDSFKEILKTAIKGSFSTAKREYYDDISYYIPYMYMTEPQREVDPQVSLGANYSVERRKLEITETLRVYNFWLTVARPDDQDLSKIDSQRYLDQLYAFLCILYPTFKERYVVKTDQESLYMSQDQIIAPSVTQQDLNNYFLNKNPSMTKVLELHPTPYPVVRPADAIARFFVNEPYKDSSRQVVPTTDASNIWAQQLGTAEIILQNKKLLEQIRSSLVNDTSLVRNRSWEPTDYQVDRKSLQILTFPPSRPLFDEQGNQISSILYNQDGSPRRWQTVNPPNGEKFRVPIMVSFSPPSITVREQLDNNEQSNNALIYEATDFVNGAFNNIDPSEIPHRNLKTAITKKINERLIELVNEFVTLFSQNSSATNNKRVFLPKVKGLFEKEKETQRESIFSRESEVILEDITGVTDSFRIQAPHTLNEFGAFLETQALYGASTSFTNENLQQIRGNYSTILEFNLDEKENSPNEIVTNLKILQDPHFLKNYNTTGAGNNRFQEINLYSCKVFPEKVISWIGANLTSENLFDRLSSGPAEANSTNSYSLYYKMMQSGSAKMYRKFGFVANPIDYRTSYKLSKEFIMEDVMDQIYDAPFISDERYINLIENKLQGTPYYEETENSEGCPVQNRNFKPVDILINFDEELDSALSRIIESMRDPDAFKSIDFKKPSPFEEGLRDAATNLLVKVLMYEYALRAGPAMSAFSAKKIFMHEYTIDFLTNWILNYETRNNPQFYKDPKTIEVFRDSLMKLTNKQTPEESLRKILSEEVVNVGKRVDELFGSFVPDHKTSFFGRVPYGSVFNVASLKIKRVADITRVSTGVKVLNKRLFNVEQAIRDFIEINRDNVRPVQITNSDSCGGPSGLEPLTVETCIKQEFRDECIQYINNLYAAQYNTQTEDYGVALTDLSATDYALKGGYALESYIRLGGDLARMYSKINIQFESTKEALFDLATQRRQGSQSPSPQGPSQEDFDAYGNIIDPADGPSPSPSQDSSPRGNASSSPSPRNTSYNGPEYDDVVISPAEFISFLREDLAAPLMQNLGEELSQLGFTGEECNYKPMFAKSYPSKFIKLDRMHTVIDSRHINHGGPPGYEIHDESFQKIGTSNPRKNSWHKFIGSPFENFIKLENSDRDFNERRRVDGWDNTRFFAVPYNYCDVINTREKEELLIEASTNLISNNQDAFQVTMQSISGTYGKDQNIPSDTTKAFKYNPNLHPSNNVDLIDTNATDIKKNYKFVSIRQNPALVELLDLSENNSDEKQFSKIQWSAVNPGQGSTSIYEHDKIIESTPLVQPRTDIYGVSDEYPTQEKIKELLKKSDVYGNFASRDENVVYEINQSLWNAMSRATQSPDITTNTYEHWTQYVIDVVGFAAPLIDVGESMHHPDDLPIIKNESLLEKSIEKSTALIWWQKVLATPYHVDPMAADGTRARNHFTNFYTTDYFARNADATKESLLQRGYRRNRYGQGLNPLQTRMGGFDGIVEYLEAPRCLLSEPLRNAARRPARSERDDWTGNVSGYYGPELRELLFENYRMESWQGNFGAPYNKSIAARFGLSEANSDNPGSEYSQAFGQVMEGALHKYRPDMHLKWIFTNQKRSSRFWNLLYHAAGTPELVNTYNIIKNRKDYASNSPAADSLADFFPSSEFTDELHMYPFKKTGAGRGTAENSYPVDDPAWVQYGYTLNGDSSLFVQGGDNTGLVWNASSDLNRDDQRLIGRNWWYLDKSAQFDYNPILYTRRRQWLFGDDAFLSPSGREVGYTWNYVPANESDWASKIEKFDASNLLYNMYMPGPKDIFSGKLQDIGASLTMEPEKTIADDLESGNQAIFMAVFDKQTNGETRMIRPIGTAPDSFQKNSLFEVDYSDRNVAAGLETFIGDEMLSSAEQDWHELRAYLPDIHMNHKWTYQKSRHYEFIAANRQAGFSYVFSDDHMYNSAIKSIYGNESRFVHLRMIADTIGTEHIITSQGRPDVDGYGLANQRGGGRNSPAPIPGSFMSLAEEYTYRYSIYNSFLYEYRRRSDAKEDLRDALERVDLRAGAGAGENRWRYSLTPGKINKYDPIFTYLNLAQPPVWDFRRDEEEPCPLIPDQPSDEAVKKAYEPSGKFDFSHDDRNRYHHPEVVFTEVLGDSQSEQSRSLLRGASSTGWGPIWLDKHLPVDEYLSYNYANYQYGNLHRSLYSQGHPMRLLSPEQTEFIDRLATEDDCHAQAIQAEQFGIEDLQVSNPSLGFSFRVLRPSPIIPVARDRVFFPSQLGNNFGGRSCVGAYNLTNENGQYKFSRYGTDYAYCGRAAHAVSHRSTFRPFGTGHAGGYKQVDGTRVEFEGEAQGVLGTTSINGERPFNSATEIDPYDFQAYYHLGQNYQRNLPRLFFFQRNLINNHTHSKNQVRVPLRLLITRSDMYENGQKIDTNVYFAYDIPKTLKGADTITNDQGQLVPKPDHSRKCYLQAGLNTCINEYLDYAKLDRTPIIDNLTGLYEDGIGSDFSHDIGRRKNLGGFSRFVDDSEDLSPYRQYHNQWYKILWGLVAGKAIFHGSPRTWRAGSPEASTYYRPQWHDQDRQPALTTDRTTMSVEQARSYYESIQTRAGYSQWLSPWFRQRALVKGGWHKATKIDRDLVGERDEFAKAAILHNNVPFFEWDEVYNLNKNVGIPNPPPVTVDRGLYVNRSYTSGMRYGFSPFRAATVFENQLMSINSIPVMVRGVTEIIPNFEVSNLYARINRNSGIPVFEGALAPDPIVETAPIMESHTINIDNPLKDSTVISFDELAMLTSNRAKSGASNWWYQPQNCSKGMNLQTARAHANYNMVSSLMAGAHISRPDAGYSKLNAPGQNIAVSKMVDMYMTFAGHSNLMDVEYLSNMIQSESFILNSDYEFHPEEIAIPESYSRTNQGPDRPDDVVSEEIGGVEYLNRIEGKGTNYFRDLINVGEGSNLQNEKYKNIVRSWGTRKGFTTVSKVYSTAAQIEVAYGYAAKSSKVQQDIIGSAKTDLNRNPSEERVVSSFSVLREDIDRQFAENPGFLIKDTVVMNPRQYEGTNLLPLNEFQFIDPINYNGQGISFNALGLRGYKSGNQVDFNPVQLDYSTFWFEREGVVYNSQNLVGEGVTNFVYNISRGNPKSINNAFYFHAGSPDSQDLSMRFNRIFSENLFRFERSPLPVKNVFMNVMFAHESITFDGLYPYSSYGDSNTLDPRNVFMNKQSFNLSKYNASKNMRAMISEIVKTELTKKSPVGIWSKMSCPAWLSGFDVKVKYLENSKFFSNFRNEDFAPPVTQPSVIMQYYGLPDHDGINAVRSNLPHSNLFIYNKDVSPTRFGMFSYSKEPNRGTLSEFADKVDLEDSHVFVRKPLKFLNESRFSSKELFKGADNLIKDQSSILPEDIRDKLENLSDLVDELESMASADVLRKILYGGLESNVNFGLRLAKIESMKVTNDWFRTLVNNVESLETGHLMERSFYTYLENIAGTTGKVLAHNIIHSIEKPFCLNSGQLVPNSLDAFLSAEGESLPFFMDNVFNMQGIFNKATGDMLAEMARSEPFNILSNYVYPIEDYRSSAAIYSSMVTTSMQDMPRLLLRTKNALLTLISGIGNKQEIGNSGIVVAGQIPDNADLVPMFKNVGSAGPLAPCGSLPGFAEDFWQKVWDIIKYIPTSILATLAMALDPAYRDMYNKFHNCTPVDQHIRSLDWGAVSWPGTEYGFGIKRGDLVRGTLDGSRSGGKYAPLLPAFPADLWQGLTFTPVGPIPNMTFANAFLKLANYIIGATGVGAGSGAGVSTPCFGADTSAGANLDVLDGTNAYGHPLLLFGPLALGMNSALPLPGDNPRTQRALCEIGEIKSGLITPSENILPGCDDN